MYGKLEDGRFIKAKHFIKTEKETILNPTDEMYERYGFKKVREDELPKIEDGHMLKMWYEETEAEIVKRYDVIAVEQE